MKYEQMLANASEIQHYMNILEASEYCEVIHTMDKGYQIYFLLPESNIGASWIDVPEKVGKFLAKGRKLRSGLASPMARYYGYRALERFVS